MDRPLSVEDRVEQHYAQPDLERSILDALVAAGKDIDRLTTVDLAPVDENHIGGREATIALTAQLGLAAGMHVLDVGCGIGGASRYMAEQYGCRVTGIDLTADFIRTAEALARRLGLHHRVSYRRASALALPFGPQTFDGATMMHVGMNISDKPRLFAEIRRVLKDGAAIRRLRRGVDRNGKDQLSPALRSLRTPASSSARGTIARCSRRRASRSNKSAITSRSHARSSSARWRAPGAKGRRPSGCTSCSNRQRRRSSPMS
jgi:ubiquinone/menaquinone biosynthesis C-methylase UbiE